MCCLACCLHEHWRAAHCLASPLQPASAAQCTCACACHLAGACARCCCRPALRRARLQAPRGCWASRCSAHGPRCLQQGPAAACRACCAPCWNAAAEVMPWISLSVQPAWWRAWWVPARLIALSPLQRSHACGWLRLTALHCWVLGLPGGNCRRQAVLLPGSTAGGWLQPATISGPLGRAPAFAA